VEVEALLVVGAMLNGGRLLLLMYEVDVVCC